MLEIAVCDDDIADLECAVNMLHKIFTSQKIAYHIEQFASANQMLENISNIDIGILDISMEELNGIKLGRKLKEKFPDVKLVYITSYEEYCMQVINEVHAFSFLCKPLEYDKLELQILELLNQLPDAIEDNCWIIRKLWMIKSCTSYTEWRSTLNWRTRRIILEAALMNWTQCL